MQAQVSREGEIVIVQLMGRVDVESADLFRKACLERLSDSPVVFSFEQLSFVGSSGILQFLETMQSFKLANEKGLRFSNVGVEFRRLFAATPLHDILIYENTQMAFRSFTDPNIASIPHEHPSVREALINFESLFSTSDLAIEDSAVEADDESITEI